MLESDRICKAGKMAQQGKTCVDKPDDLSSILEPTRWKERIDSHRFVNRARTLPSRNTIPYGIIQYFNNDH